MSREISATPARVTRARSKTPLPAISSKQSHAYGAQGKSDLRSQVRSSGADFNQEFESTRMAPQLASVAGDEDDDDLGAAASSPSKKGGRGGRRGLQTAILEEDEAEMASPPPPPEPAVPDRTATALDAAADYAGGVGGNRPEIRVVRPEPSRFRDFLLYISVITILMTLWAWVPVPAAVAPVRERFFVGMKAAFHVAPYDRPPEQIERLWLKFRHDLELGKLLPDTNVPELQWSFNINVFSRLEMLEAQVMTIKNEMSLQNDTILHLQQILPRHIVVRGVDGQYEIPEAFWLALQQRLDQDGDIAPVWQSYLSKNEQRIRELHQQFAGEALDQAVEKQHVITRADFIGAIRENNEWLAEHYREDYQRLWAENLDNLKSTVVRLATDVIERSPVSAVTKDHLKLLTKANQLHKVYESLRSVNWFAVGQGARVDPRLTSPTKGETKISWLRAVYRSLSPLMLTPHPPLAALQHWDEATECWCGTLGTNREVQISVHTSEKIFPESLVIEHIPAEGTRDIAAAPRDFEVWVETRSKKEAKKIQKVVDSELPYQYDLPRSEPPSAKHVCILQNYYGIHELNHIQSFQVWPNAAEMGLGVNKFTVKVNTNWGSNYTCLYRLRMTGQKAIA